MDAKWKTAGRKSSIVVLETLPFGFARELREGVMCCCLIDRRLDARDTTDVYGGNPQLFRSQMGTYHRTHRLLLNLAYIAASRWEMSI